MVREGLIFLNTKNSLNVVLKVNEQNCYLLSRTKDGFALTHPYKGFVEYQLKRCKYKIVKQYSTFAEAIASKEFKNG